MSDFDDDPTTHVDGEVADLTAEAEVLSGPSDGERELTPTRLDGCKECGGKVEPIENWRAPADAEEAWGKWHMACVRSFKAMWEFCPVTGGMWHAGKRYDFERRKKAPKPRPWDGVERRRGGA